MTVEIEVHTTIGAPPARVWAVIEDVGSHVDWMADAVSITFRTDQRAGVGTELECLTRVGPLRTVDVMTITEWEPERAMGIEHRGGVTGRGRFTLRRAGSGLTEFAWCEQLTFPWWMGGRLGERLGRPVLTRIWRANLARLRAKVERSS